MPTRPSAGTLALLTVPPLMWASNAIVGRLSVAGGEPLISPLTLNFLRWVVTLALLVPLVLLAGKGKSVARTPGGPGSGLPAATRSGSRIAALVQAMRRNWRIYAAYGALAVAGYNALQYLALRTSSPINVTLIAAGGPLFVLLIGRLFFGAHAPRWAWLGASLSLVGVLVVLTGGDAGRLATLRLVPGDLLMVVATIVWALYSWLLRQHRPEVSVLELLLLQTIWGVALSVPVVGAEWLSGHLALRPSPVTVAVVVWVAVGPSLLAYWCWDRGVARAGPLLPSFFANLTPLLTALLSAALLGEPPRAFHAVAFALIVGGIVISQRRPRRA